MIAKLFMPDHYVAMYAFMAVLMFIVVPWLSYQLWHQTGRAICRLRHSHRNYLNLVGLLSVPIIWYITIYGVFFGFPKLEVSHLEYVSPDLPEAFDGYRIVHFSDAHVGTLSGIWKELLQRDIDSINAQKPDLIVFTGDLQNAHPQEIYPHLDQLNRLQATDGIYAVLGNHDYAEYIHADEVTKAANCRETISLERQLGWKLLLNEHRFIERGKSRIVVAGMENDGNGRRFPQKGDIPKTLQGVSDSDFILMLEHDPASWRRRILPQSHAQLTLSGHTHAMQFKIGDWSPIAVMVPEWYGLYSEGSQSLYVTSGMGALIPFRFGATAEIAVITLRRK